MYITVEQKKKQYRILYETLFRTPKVPRRAIDSALGGSRKAGARMREAFDQQYIVGPHINKRSYANLKEYMVLISCENPEPLYLKYQEDMNIIYHAQTIGFCDLWVIAKEEIDIEGDVVVEGYRSDYYFPYAPNRSWEESLQIMWEKTNSFRSKDYALKGIIKTHLNESAQWDSEDEELYQYFKYGLRKKLSPVISSHGILEDKIFNWFQRLPECCTTYTGYYPETLSAYDPYLFMIDGEPVVILIGIDDNLHGYDEYGNIEYAHMRELNEKKTYEIVFYQKAFSSVAALFHMAGHEGQHIVDYMSESHTSEQSAWGWNGRNDCSPPYYMPFPFPRSQFPLLPLPRPR